MSTAVIEIKVDELQKELNQMRNEWDRNIY